MTRVPSQATSQALRFLLAGGCRVSTDQDTRRAAFHFYASAFWPYSHHLNALRLLAPCLARRRAMARCCRGPSRSSGTARPREWHHEASLEDSTLWKGQLIDCLIPSTHRHCCTAQPSGDARGRCPASRATPCDSVHSGRRCPDTPPAQCRAGQPPTCAATRGSGLGSLSTAP